MLTKCTTRRVERAEGGSCCNALRKLSRSNAYIGSCKCFEFLRNINFLLVVILHCIPANSHNIAKRRGRGGGGSDSSLFLISICINLQRDKNRPSKNDEERKSELCNELRKSSRFAIYQSAALFIFSGAAALLLLRTSVESALNIDAFAYWLSSFSFTSSPPLSCLAKHQDTNSLQRDRERGCRKCIFTTTWGHVLDMAINELNEWRVI